MKNIIIAAITASTLLASFATSASAGWTSQKIGSITYINGTGSSAGSNFSCQTIGNRTYCN
jgi:hypothetical protein